jgi:hypothetical protein
MEDRCSLRSAKSSAASVALAVALSALAQPSVSAAPCSKLSSLKFGYYAQASIAVSPRDFQPYTLCWETVTAVNHLDSKSGDKAPVSAAK